MKEIVGKIFSPRIFGGFRLFKLLTRRIIWQAKCDCGEYEEATIESPPKEIQCPRCKKWIRFEKTEWTGPDTFK